MQGTEDTTAALPDRLDILKVPLSGNTTGYQSLVELLLELQGMMGSPIDQAALREWEARACAHLEPHEVDLLFLRPERDDFLTAELPSERPRNLRKFLLRRKGIRA